MENVVGAVAQRTRESLGAPRATAARPRILLVEDDFTLRAYLAELLIQEGYDVVCAADGAEAIGRLQREAAAPAAILLDIMLPRMGGVSFRQVQLRSADLRDVPTLAMTGTSNAKELSKLQFDAVLRKPIDLDRLVDMLAKFCPQS
ncbi:MAG TPA: response regulator [Polyangia bacterium]|nr:response regulator [Polyangia bacterium]HVY38849.1 response regulator [Polyangia bacterium]